MGFRFSQPIGEVMKTRTKSILFYVAAYILTMLAAVGLVMMLDKADGPEHTYTEYPPSVATTTVINTPTAIDLTGRWESNVSKSGTKMIGHIKNGTVHVEMYADEAYTGLWYGTFDILQPGEKTLTSKYIDDPQHFVLSSAETKDFTYDSGALKFDFSVMGTRTTVEMRRVAG
jgi:hypothetical protein